jgi:hypothetical protein
MASEPREEHVSSKKKGARMRLATYVGIIAKFRLEVNEKAILLNDIERESRQLRSSSSSGTNPTYLTSEMQRQDAASQKRLTAFVRQITKELAIPK